MIRNLTVIVFAALALAFNARAASEAELEAAARGVLEAQEEAEYAASNGIPKYLLNTTYIAKTFGIQAGEEAAVSPGLRIRVPAGMRILLQPHASAFLRLGGLTQIAGARAIAIPYDETYSTYLETLINTQGLMVVVAKDIGHVVTDGDGSLDAADLLDRYRSAMRPITGREVGDAEVGWVTPPVFYRQERSLARSALVSWHRNGEQEAIELANIDMLGNTSVVSLSLIVPVAAETNHDSDDKPMQLLRKLAANVQFDPGYRYWDFHDGQDAISEKKLQDLVAPKPTGFIAATWAFLKQFRLTTWLYFLGAVFSISAWVMTKRAAREEERVRADGIDAVGKFVEVDWTTNGKGEQYLLCFTVDVQLPDGKIATERRLFNLTKERVDEIKANIAVGKPCYVRLDPKKHSNIVLMEKWHD